MRSESNEEKERSRRLGVGLLLLLLLLFVPGELASADPAGGPGAKRISGSGPTAVAVADDGTVFVGFPSGAIVSYEGGSGGRGDSLNIKRFNAAIGDRQGKVGGVVALDIASEGGKERIWVLDENRRVQQFTFRGKLRRSLKLKPCDSGTKPAAGERGGLDVTSDSIFVAHPCRDQVARYDRSDLDLRASVGVDDPHGLAAQSNPSAPRASQRLYVAETAVGQVAVLGLRDLARYDAMPHRGEVADVYAAADGRIFISDVRDDEAWGERIYVYDAAGSQLANLGRPGPDLGDLDNPVAFDFHPLDTSAYSENLFIADFGNERVQRWSDDGFTYWGSAASDPGR